MNPVIHNERQNPVALYLAFFTIGLLDASYPLLDRHLNYFIHNDYYVRILSFTCLLLLSFLSVMFSRTWSGKNSNIWLALLTLVPGMLLSLLNTKSMSVIFLSALFLLAGSLFVQVSGLKLLTPPVAKQLVPGKIFMVYLFNSSGLLAGMLLISLRSVSGLPCNHLLIYISFVFMLLSMALLYFFPYPKSQVITFPERVSFNLRKLFSNKPLVLMLGGLIIFSGAELCLKGILPYYFSEIFGISITRMIIPGIGLFMSSFFTGRIAGVILIRKTGSDKIFLFSSILAILGISALYIGQKHLSIAATIMMGLGTANILPVMILLTLERISEGMKWLIGLIIGTMPLGAFIPTLMWAMSDSISTGISLTIPIFCLFYVTWIAIVLIKKM